MAKYKFTLPEGCSAHEIVLRETDGTDEATAIQLAKAKGEQGSMLDELMRLAVTSVDGEAATQPFSAPTKWNSKTRSLVLKAFLKINGADDKTEADFLAAGEVLAD